MLLLILGIFIYKNYKAQIEESDIIIEVNKDNLTKTSEENVLNFYEKNREPISRLFFYFKTTFWLKNCKKVEWVGGFFISLLEVKFRQAKVL